MPINEIYDTYGILGQGNFGMVYKGINRTTNGLVAIKMDELNSLLLERECYFYDFLWNRIVEKQLIELLIPAYFWSGIENNKRILITERLGISLDKLYDRYNRTWTKSTIYWITYKGLSLLKELHSVGILHRDIKPDNFAIGYKEQNQLYIFDFGLAAKYIEEETGQHWEFNNGYSIIGTSRYASVYNHYGFKQSRRDDLESFYYMCYYLWNGMLPWLDYKIEYGDKNAYILKIKKTIIWENVVDIPDIYKEFISYVKMLNFKETPDYDVWIERFREKAGNGNPDWVLETVNVRSVPKTKKMYKREEKW